MRFGKKFQKKFVNLRRHIDMNKDKEKKSVGCAKNIVNNFASEKIFLEMSKIVPEYHR